LLLCLALVTVFGGANLMLGYLVSQNEARQLAQMEQYRRFEIIQTTGEALALYRHRESEVNTAILLKNKQSELEARTRLEHQRSVLEMRLSTLESFDGASAATIRRALSELPAYQSQMIEALAQGRRPDMDPAGDELKKRLELIQKTLNDASERERGLARSLQTQEMERTKAAQRLAATIIILASALGVLGTLVVIRSVIRPLVATTHAIRQVNKGQIDIDLPPVTGDEFGDMALALRQFRDQAERLRKLAYEDPLTGLGNRAFLEESLRDRMQLSSQSRRRLGVLFVDLDNFRAVNDRWGYKTGDRYLCEAVNRIQRFIPEETLLCRYAGDSFVVLIEGLSYVDSAEVHLREIADCALRGLAEPYAVGEQLINMSVSIGIAVYPEDGETVEQLISGADAAMYVAKKNGRNNVRFASSAATGSFRKRLAIASDIRRGLDEGEFEAFYQPIVDVGLGKVVGAEALLRWRHPERGLLLPGEFIQTAEQAGLINKLGEQCLIQAHQQSRRWRAVGRDLRISVNLSAHQVHEGKILPLLRRLQDEVADSTALIDFELTESALLDAAEFGQNVLSEIREMGYRLGLDDFGTGYSSLSYLKRLPIDKVKIDREFVTGIASSSQASLAIVSAVVALGRSLNLGIVAEGVESLEQLRQLQEIGCSLQQGFHFSVALPAVEFDRWRTAFERDMQIERGGKPGPNLIRG